MRWLAQLHTDEENPGCQSLRLPVTLTVGVFPDVHAHNSEVGSEVAVLGHRVGQAGSWHVCLLRSRWLFPTSEALRGGTRSTHFAGVDFSSGGMLLERAIMFSLFSNYLVAEITTPI